MKPKSKNKVRPKSETKSGINWDLIIKSIGAVVAVIGILFGIYQYLSKDENDKKQVLRAQKIELYKKATEIAASFPQSSDQKEANEKAKQFWAIYYGQLSIVEDENVKQAMMRYGGALKAWERFNAPPSDYFPPSDFVYYPEGSNKPGLTFEELSYEITQACKESINK